MESREVRRVHDFSCTTGVANGLIFRTYYTRFQQLFINASDATCCKYPISTCYRLVFNNGFASPSLFSRASSARTLAKSLRQFHRRSWPDLPQGIRHNLTADEGFRCVDCAWICALF